MRTASPRRRRRSACGSSRSCASSPSPRWCFPIALRADVQRLVSAATPRQRLGLPAEATPDELVASAGAAAARWRRFQNDGRRGAEERRAAHVVALALAGIAGDALRRREAPA